jgi:hypothetical protein
MKSFGPIQIIFGFLMLLATTGASNSPAPRDSVVTVPPNHDWLACTSDSMCTVTNLSCHGWVAINRLHEQEMQTWYSQENADILAVVECDGPRQPQPGAVCRNYTCQLK